MGVDRETLHQVGLMLRPLATRVANSIARAVVQLVDDGKQLQLVQLGALPGETIDGAEHHQPYGFSSVPLPGAEAVLVFPGGDRGHPLAVAVSDRRHRPTGGEAGEVVMYHHAGARVTMLASGDVEIRPASGGKVYVRSEGGSAVPLATLADVEALRDTFNAHTHAYSPGPGSPTPTAAPATLADAPAGTSVLKAE